MTAPARPGWRRLWRPSHPLFWLMLFFNVLSSLGAWAMRILPLSDLGLLVIGGMALGNAILGLMVMARLWRLP
jgi:4-hydroxybenzoate polyprenyltransferase